MIVVFDGACNACNAYVRFLSARDRQRRLSFVAAGTEQGRAILTACGESPDDPSTMVVVDGDVRQLRSDAVVAAIAALGGGWRLVRLLAFVPRPLRNAAYTAFARRRYRWFGRADACPLAGVDTRPLQ